MPVHPGIERLKAAIAPEREALLQHPINQYIQGPAELERFMQHHVFAVWDFMSLLTSLQGALTCTQLPWKPVGDAETRYLIHEIVLGESADVDQFGQYTSHFELYQKAMRDLGFAPLPCLQRLLQCQSVDEVLLALEQAEDLPASIKQFLGFTFQSIKNGSVEALASIFTFGREDLIPGMFSEIVAHLKKEAPERIETLIYYLDRHIEVDGDHHSHLAFRMVAQLCGDDADKWADAEQAAKSALQHRIALWDGIVAEVMA